jgi:rubrerythrin
MSTIFSGSEIVEIGIEIEKNGKAFYEEVLKNASDDNAEVIFKYLANEEGKHIAVFEKMLDSVKKYEPIEAYPGEYFSYMKALANEHVFTKKDVGVSIAKEVKDDLGAIVIGIKFEKDSIIFYEGMKKVVPEVEHRLLDSLIEQEQVHLNKLEALRENF